MLRIILAAAVLIAVAAFDARPVRAFGDAPWCAYVSLGFGAFQNDCSYRTFEECVPNVLGGNRGFCNQNPNWVGRPAAVPKAQRKRHVNRD